MVRLLHDLALSPLLPAITVICGIGVYKDNQQTIDLIPICGSGVLGYFIRKRGYPARRLRFNGRKVEVERED